MHCSSLVFIFSIICKRNMALGTNLEAAIESYSTKVGIEPAAISKKELFVTLCDCLNELHIRCCRSPRSACGFKFSFCINNKIKKLYLYFFYFP